MSKVKDFFYDKNDIIVTLIILLIAATIIYVRVGAIMDYPNTLVDTGSDSKQAAASPSAAAPSEASTAAATNATIVIAAGDITAAAVAQDLKEKRLISSASDFQKTLKEYKLTSKIKAGTYEIPAGATDKQIIEIITQETIKD